MVGELEELIIAVACHHESHDELISHLDARLAIHSHELWPGLRLPLHEKLLVDRELRPAHRREIGDVVEILPVDAAESEPLLLPRERDIPHPGLDLAAREPRLDESCPRLGTGRAVFPRLDLLAADIDGHQLRRSEEIRAAAEEGADGIGRSPVAAPLARALLRQEPDLERLDGIAVTGHLVEGLDHDSLRLDRRCGPLPPGRMGIAPPHPLPGILLLARLHVGVDGALPEAVDDRQRRLPVA